MKHSETAALLAVAAAFDNRKITEDAVEAWQRALHPDLNLADGRQIIVDHYADSTEWLKPAHINTAYRRMCRHRLETIGTDIRPPHQLDLISEQAWFKEFRNAVAAGQTSAEAELAATRVIAPELEPAVRQQQLEPATPNKDNLRKLQAHLKELNK